jgi:hypothetical protein
MKLIKIFKNFIWSKFPLLTRIYGAILNKKGFYTFEGWGLITTSTFPPWVNILKNKLDFNNIFLKIDKDLKERIKKKKFYSSKVLYGIDPIDYLDKLKWRHYIVYWSSIYASSFNVDRKAKNFVECGVADGFSAFFSINSIKFFLKKNFFGTKFYLYDQWEGMKAKDISKNELGATMNKYDFLDVKNAKFNLEKYSDVAIFNQGNIPLIFKKKKVKHPKKISWLHIDLNSAKPTIDVLKFFYNKIKKNGIILLDDYGGAGYIPTKLAVDKFMNNKSETIFQLPTGQAIIIKK